MLSQIDYLVNMSERWYTMNDGGSACWQQFTGVRRSSNEAFSYHEFLKVTHCPFRHVNVIQAMIEDRLDSEILHTLFKAAMQVVLSDVCGGQTYVLFETALSCSYTRPLVRRHFQ